MNRQMSEDSCCKFDKNCHGKSLKFIFKTKVGMNSDTIITLHVGHFSKLNYIKFVNYIQFKILILKIIL